LIERNRAPFDLLEGERELIRGFNVELGSLTFVFLFLREYGVLIVLAILSGNLLIESVLISPVLLG
jgi:NADH-ubiquinone oxidoreductase chain 1